MRKYGGAAWSVILSSVLAAACGGDDQHPRPDAGAPDASAGHPATGGRSASGGAVSSGGHGADTGTGGSTASGGQAATGGAGMTASTGGAGGSPASDGGSGGVTASDGGSGGVGGSTMNTGGTHGTPDASRDASEDHSSSGGAAGHGGAPITDGGMQPDACTHERFVDAGPPSTTTPRPYSLDISVTSGTAPAIVSITCPFGDGGTRTDSSPHLLDQHCVSSCPGAACSYCFDSPASGLPLGPGCTADLIVSGRPGVGPGANAAHFDVTGDPQPAVDCQPAQITGAVSCKLTWPPACVTPRAECGGQCVDLTKDANHCGACNRVCTNGDSCVKGECVCASQAYCNGGCACTDLSTDNANCGACGHVCDGTCTTGRCVKKLNAPYSTSDALRLALDATSLYWTTQVSKMPIGGGTVTSLSDNGDAQGIALSSDTVFFTEYTHGLVRKVPKAGGAIVTLASNQKNPRGIAVDATNVYWASEGASTATGSVWSVPIAGGTPVQLASGGMYTTDVAVDATDVYFIDQNSVMRKPLAGGNAVVFAAAKNGWALRLDANNVYWAEYGGGVNQQSKSGGSPIPIVTVESGSIYGLAVDDRFVYWSLYPTGSGIRKAPIGGGPVTTVLDVSSPSIAVDATSLYFTNYFEGTVSRVTPK